MYNLKNILYAYFYPRSQSAAFGEPWCGNMRGCACACVGAVWLHRIPGVYVREAGALALTRLVLVFVAPFTLVSVCGTACRCRARTGWVPWTSWGDLSAVFVFLPRIPRAFRYKKRCAAFWQPLLCSGECFSVLQVVENILIGSLLPKYFII